MITNKLNRKEFYTKIIPINDEITGKRVYITPDNQKLPSVTTILKEIYEKEDIKKWRESVGQEKADEIINESRNIGTLVHKNIESFIESGNYLSGNNLIRSLARNMAKIIVDRFLYNVEEIWGLEVSLWYPGLYAGTADIIFKKGNNLYIGDFKTTNKKKKDEQIFDYKIQTVAYAIAHNNLYNTKIEKTNIFMISRNLDLQFWEVNNEEFYQIYDFWVKILEKYYTKKDSF